MTSLRTNLGWSGVKHHPGATIAACGASLRRYRSLWVPNTRGCARQRGYEQGSCQLAMAVALPAAIHVL